MENLEDREEPAIEESNESEPVVFKPPTPWATFSLIAVLFAVFATQLFADGSDGLIFGGENSLVGAAFIKPFFLDGQYWRIMTGALLHGGIIHLGFNCYALYILGQQIEFLSNRVHLPTIFVLAAIGGNILSLIAMPGGVSLGASGGIIGFLGYLTVYAFKRRRILPPGFLRAMLMNIGLLVLVGVLSGLRIDNFAHLGGLLVGAVYGLMQVPSDLHVDPRSVSPLSQWLGRASFILIIGFAIFTVLVLTGIVSIRIPQVEI